MSYYEISNEKFIGHMLNFCILIFKDQTFALILLHMKSQSHGFFDVTLTNSLPVGKI